MVKVAINYEDEMGTVTYYPDTKEVMITHPKALVRNRVRKYLTTEKSYETPRGYGEMSEHSLEWATPTDTTFYMEMALCELRINTGVTVDWSNIWTSSKRDDDVEGDTEGSVLKSHTGDEDFIIIN